MSAGNTLYLKIGKNIVVTDRRVTLGDLEIMHDFRHPERCDAGNAAHPQLALHLVVDIERSQIGRASCRERV